MNIIIKNYIQIIQKYQKYKYFIFHFFNVKIGSYSSIQKTYKIGFIDQDGLIHVPTEYNSYFNPNDLYIGNEFLHRKRFCINVLLENGLILLEKNFSTNFFAFYNELTILNELKNYDFVPKIYFVNYKSHSLIINYIDGFVLREKIAKLTTEVRDIDKKLNRFNDTNKIFRDPAIIVKDIINPFLLKKIVDSVDKIHQKKILIKDIKYGNIIIKNENPFLIDFNDSIFFQHTPKFIFNRIKKSDVLLLQNIFRYII